MRTIVQWCDWKGKGLDRCAFSQTGEGATFEGVVIGSREGRYGAHYFVRTDTLFRTREVRVEYVEGPRLHITADGEGHWHDLIRGKPISHLYGCIDVDIGVTPATNTLPIRRLNLKENESQDIVVAYVPLLSQIETDFLPQAAEQRYSCVALNQRYRYEGIFRGFTAELEIDPYGLVRDYPDTFRRTESL